MKKPMPYEKFEVLMNTLIEFQDKRDMISNFLEKEICTDSFCLVTFGTDLENKLINLIADEFECWYSFRGKEATDYDWWINRTAIENDIENFLYQVTEDPMRIEVDGKEFIITTVKELYDYLVFSYERAHENLTED